MNKRVLKSYLNGSNKQLLAENCFKYENGYLISDSYSIIKLNTPNELIIAEKDILGLSKIYESFVNNYEFLTDYIPLWLELEKIDDEYGIQMKLFKRINTIIRGNKYAIMRAKDNLSSARYVIKLENTKTNEIAYMLPARVY